MEFWVAEIDTEREDLRTLLLTHSVHQRIALSKKHERRREAFWTTKNEHGALSRKRLLRISLACWLAQLPARQSNPHPPPLIRQPGLRIRRFWIVSLSSPKLQAQVKSKLAAKFAKVSWPRGEVTGPVDEKSNGKIQKTFEKKSFRKKKHLQLQFRNSTPASSSVSQQNREMSHLHHSRSSVPPVPDWDTTNFGYVQKPSAVQQKRAVLAPINQTGVIQRYIVTPIKNTVKSLNVRKVLGNFQSAEILFFIFCSKFDFEISISPSFDLVHFCGLFCIFRRSLCACPCGWDQFFFVSKQKLVFDQKLTSVTGKGKTVRRRGIPRCMHQFSFRIFFIGKCSWS